MSAADDAFYRAVVSGEPLSQGDIIADVACIDASTGPGGKKRDVIVLSHSCELDKPDCTCFYAAGVKPVAKEGPRIQEAIRTGKVANTVYLPPVDALKGDCFADLRLMFRVPFAQVEAILREMPDGSKQRFLGDGKIRLIGLSERGVLAIRQRVAQYFTRTDLPVGR